MNRADRLYAIVEELRAVSPRLRTAAWPARRFEISTRTIERDLLALRESGVATRGGVGRAGGYFLDRDRTLPPVTLTPTEALAISVALRSVTGSPFGAAARIAAHKVLAVLPADVRLREESLAKRVHTLGEESPRVGAATNDTVSQAVATERVLREPRRRPHKSCRRADGPVVLPRRVVSRRLVSAALQRSRLPAHPYRFSEIDRRARTSV